MAKEISLDRDTFKALAGETRVSILKELQERRKTQSELAAKLGVSPPTVNEHLELLKKADLVAVNDEGRKWKYYSLTAKGKDLLNPSETRILVILGISSLALAGYSLYLFGRFFPAEVGRQAPGMAADAATNEALTKTLAAVTPSPVPMAGEIVSAGIAWPELLLFGALALVVGYLVGRLYWRPSAQKA